MNVKERHVVKVVAVIEATKADARETKVDKGLVQGHMPEAQENNKEFKVRDC